MFNKLFLIAAMILCAAGFADSQTYNKVATISVSTSDVDITAGMLASNVVVRENSDTPTAIFYITLAGQSVAQKYAAGTKFKFSAPGNHPFASTDVIGKIHASASGPFSFTISASAGEPSESMASTGGSSGSSSLSINGSTVSNPNLNASSPAPDSGFLACTWVVSGSNAICELAAVPTSRTVNGFALSSNISLVASDVGAPPTSRTVCGHALSSNVACTPSDVSLGSVTNDAQTKAAIVPNTVPSAGQVLVGNAGGTAYAPVTLSGCTLSSSGVLTCSGATWNSISNPGGSLSLSMGSNTSTFNTTTALSSFFSWKNTTAANSGTSQGSPFLNICGREWHSSADVEGCITLNFLPGNGADAASTFTIAHSGTATGAVTTVFPGPVQAGTAGGVGGLFNLPEGTAPSGASSADVCYADSSTHRIKCSLNNAGFTEMSPTTNQNIREINAVFDGAGSALSGTTRRCKLVNFAGTIQGITLLADQSGSATVKVLTVAYASYTGPASASDISNGGEALSSATKLQDTTLTSWTTSLSAGSAVCIEISSPSTITWLSASVKVAAN